MKKFLMSIITILLLILTYFVIFKNISISKWTSKNVKDVKELDSSLTEKIDTAKQLNNQEYPEKVSTLEKSIKQLKIAKERYETKLEYAPDGIDLSVVKTKEYKIERLWIALQNYALSEEIELKLEIVDTTIEDVYDINVTATGEYSSIADFISDIEKDDTLSFKILNFKLLPSTVSSSQTTEKQTTNKTESTNTTTEKKEENNTTNSNSTAETNTVENTETKKEETPVQTTTVTVNKLTATFKIENVAIDFN